MVKSTSRRSPARKKAARPASAGKISGHRGSARAKAPGKAKWVYGFGNGAAEGRADMRDLLGGKGAGLAEMANPGLPVPPGFTITTAVCTYYYGNAKTYPANLKEQVTAALVRVGRLVGKTFGDRGNPLL